MTWALKTFTSGLKQSSIWMRLAFTDIQALYKRSVIGLAWVALSFGLFIGVKILVFGSIASGEADYFAIWLSIGFWLWTFIRNMVTDGARAFLGARGWILSRNIPLSIYVFQSITRAFISFLFSLPIIIIVILVFKWYPTVSWLWAIPGFIMLILNGVWCTLLLATLCSRFNDLLHFMITFMLVMFFLTPILYLPEQMGSRAVLLQYNPFTHYLAVVRDPIMGLGVPTFSWIVVGCFTLFGFAIALYIFQILGRRVPFYVS